LRQGLLTQTAYAKNVRKKNLAKKNLIAEKYPKVFWAEFGKKKNVLKGKGSPGPKDFFC